MNKAVVAVLLAACGGSAATAVKAPKAQPDIDPAEAEKDAKGLVGEVSMSIGNGDTDGLMTLLSDQLVVFGPRKGDALASRTDALVALGKVVDAKRKRALKLDEKAMVAAPGGHSAWAFDVIDAGNGPMAVTAVLSNTDDIWLVDAVSLADTPAPAAVKTAVARDAIVPPALGTGTKVDGAAKAVVERFQRGLAGQDAWFDDLAKADEAIVIGPTQGEVVRGKKDIKKLWKKRVDLNTREVAVGDVTAAVTPDGRLAWASAPVTRTATGESLPLRVFAVFEQHDNAWQMVALQESVAIDNPGAGVAFHKAPPPAPAAEKKETVAAAEQPKAKAVKKKPAASDGDGDDEAPKAKPKKVVKKKPAVSSDDDDAVEAPKPKKVVKKKPAASDDGDDGDDDAPKAKRRRS